MVGRTFYKAATTIVLAFIVISFTSLVSKKEQKVEEQFSRSQYSYKDNDVHLSRHLMSEGAECRAVHQQPNASAKCRFIKATSDCENDDGFFDYNDFVYCRLGNVVPLAMVILILWWLFCFIGLAVTADDFFCPSLVVISKTLRLSPNVAGVTFLAFGNGAPDLFSAIAALQGGGSGMGIGGLFGAGMFVTTIVVGTIAVIRPFKAMERPFLRDVLFYMAGVYWTFTMLWRERVNLGEAIGFIGLYIAYVIVVVVSGYIYRVQKENSKEGSATIGTTPGSTDVVLKKVSTFSDLPSNPLHKSDTQLSINPQNIYKRSDSAISLNPSVEFSPEARASSSSNMDAYLDKYGLQKLDEIGEAPGNSASPPDTPTGSDKFTLGTDTELDAKQEVKSDINGNIGTKGVEPKEEPKSIVRQFLDAINPINVEEWPDMAWYAKVYEVVKSPLIFVINLTCPVVNYDEEVKNNWNKILNTLQCLWSPTILIFLTQLHTEKLGGTFPIWGLMMIIGAVAAVVVFFTSSHDKKPIYHWVFGYVGFLMAMVWIYCIANEIVNLLETFGVVFNISPAILGLTLLAWGNSIGDWIADTVMARQGYARMGFAACFGAPFFNLMLGVGIPFLIRMGRANSTSIVINLTAVQLVLTGFLLGSLLFTLIYLNLFKFKATKPYGVVLIIYYIVFLVIALLVETNVIPKNFKKP